MMKFDVHLNSGKEIKVDENTNERVSVNKNFTNLDLEAAKAKVEELMKNIPENTTDFYLSISTSYNERMQSALDSI